MKPPLTGLGDTHTLTACPECNIASKHLVCVGHKAEQQGQVEKLMTFKVLHIVFKVG